MDDEQHLSDGERAAADVESLIMELRNHTPLSRLNWVEARVVFAKVAELGYTIAAPVKPVDQAAA